MKRKRYSEEKIISILKEHEAGASVPDLARRYAVAENTIYRWKSKFGGMEIAEARKLRDLEIPLGKQLLQPRIFLLDGPEMTHVVHLKFPVALSPGEDRLFADAVRLRGGREVVSRQVV